MLSNGGPRAPHKVVRDGCQNFLHRESAQPVAPRANTANTANTASMADGDKRFPALAELAPQDEVKPEDREGVMSDARESADMDAMAEGIREQLIAFFRND